MSIEKIEALIERTDSVLKEATAFDSVSLAEKTLTLAALYQAAALTRIANDLGTNQAAALIRIANELGTIAISLELIRDSMGRFLPPVHLAILSSTEK